MIDYEKKLYKINPKKFEDIVIYFNTNIENGTSTIAKRFKMQKEEISYYLDVYLSSKKNYMGTVPRLRKEKSEIDTVLVLDENRDEIGRFKTVKQAGYKLGVNYFTIQKHLYQLRSEIVNHKNGKSYYYLKI